MLEALRPSALPEGIALAHVSSTTVQLTLAGPGAAAALRKLGAGGLEAGQHALFGFDGGPVVLLAGSGLPGMAGARLVADEAVAGALWAALTTAHGGTPVGSRAWERLRIGLGAPAAGAELPGCPLELGLAPALLARTTDFTGRDAVARIAAAGPQRMLVALRFAPGTAALLAGAAVMRAGAVAGLITSASAADGAALALLQSEEGLCTGLAVKVGEEDGAVLML